MRLVRWRAGATHGKGEGDLFFSIVFAVFLHFFLKTFMFLLIFAKFWLYCFYVFTIFFPMFCYVFVPCFLVNFLCFYEAMLFNMFYGLGDG